MLAITRGRIRDAVSMTSQSLQGNKEDGFYLYGTIFRAESLSPRVAGSPAIRDNGSRRAVLVQVFAYRYVVSERRRFIRYSSSVRTIRPRQKLRFRARYTRKYE